MLQDRGHGSDFRVRRTFLDLGYACSVCSDTVWTGYRFVWTEILRRQPSRLCMARWCSSHMADISFFAESGVELSKDHSALDASVSVLASGVSLSSC